MNFICKSLHYFFTTATSQVVESQNIQKTGTLEGPTSCAMQRTESTLTPHNPHCLLFFCCHFSTPKDTIIFYSQHLLYSQIYCFSMLLFASLYFCMEFLLGISLVFPFVKFGYETCQFLVEFLIVKMSLFLFHFIEIFFFNS